MKRTFIAAALLALATPTQAADAIVFPAPQNVRIDNYESWENSRPKWSDIPDFSFDCENGDTLTVSHQRGRAKFESGSEYKIDASDAHYQNVPDRFGNQQMAIFIDLIEGGPSTHPTWMLTGANLPQWYFSAPGRTLLKCAPND